ncbi:hypothetical protein AB9P05_00905 [Roseivirga sp. BDSF3-8]|uniref:hypothetical protein n=1 Tax=Roseivirga sp. BDSF3-8 TaxID=3241598 RepID=UPI0035320FA8
MKQQRRGKNAALALLTYGCYYLIADVNGREYSATIFGLISSNRNLHPETLNLIPTKTKCPCFSVKQGQACNKPIDRVNNISDK